MVESDWYGSKMYLMVLEMMGLPDKNRLRKSRKLEKQFINPSELDIWTEEEAAYNARILMKKS
jgi:hypothetical protein